MGVRVLYDSDGDNAVLYDSVTMTAFGPVTDPIEDLDAREVAERLIDYCSKRNGVNPRKVSAELLAETYSELREILPAVLKKEHDDAMREDD